MERRLTVRIDEATHEVLKRLAKDDRRTVAAYVAVTLERHCAPLAAKMTPIGGGTCRDCGKVGGHVDATGVWRCPHCPKR